MIVALTPREVAIAQVVGEHRQAEAAGWSAQFGDGSSTGRHVEGAIGELAVAKALGIYWTGLEQLAPADVGDYHVRFSRNEHSPLYVRPRENPEPERRYVLVTGYFGTTGGECRIVGGTTAEIAMRREPRDPGERGCPAWIVPQEDLWPLKVVRCECGTPRFARGD